MDNASISSHSLTFALYCLEVNLYAEGGADGQIVEGSFDVFVGRYAVLAMRANHLSSPIPMAVYLDNFGGKCYLVDDEFFESEEFFKTDYFQDAILEKRNNSLYALNHCSN